MYESTVYRMVLDSGLDPNKYEDLRFNFEPKFFNLSENNNHYANCIAYIKIINNPDNSEASSK